MGVVLGAHLGLAAAWRTRATAARAEKTEGKSFQNGPYVISEKDPPNLPIIPKYPWGL